MEEYMKNYYDALVENLEAYKGEYASFINHGPSLFNLLCGLLEKDISKDLRKDVCSAIGYYVVPMDVIPEQIYGPRGYIDDVYLSVYVLKLVADECGYDILQEVWDKPEDIKAVMDECETQALEVLKEEDIEAVLTYAGFK